MSDETPPAVAPKKPCCLVPSCWGRFSGPEWCCMKHRPWYEREDSEHARRIREAIANDEPRLRPMRGLR